MVEIQAAGTSAPRQASNQRPDWWGEFINAYIRANGLSQSDESPLRELMALLRNKFGTNFDPPRMLSNPKQPLDGLASRVAPGSVAAQCFNYLEAGKGIHEGKLLTKNGASISASANKLELVPATVDGKKQGLTNDDLYSLLLAAQMNGNLKDCKIKGGTFWQRRKLKSMLKEMDAGLDPLDRMNTKPGFLGGVSSGIQKAATLATTALAGAAPAGSAGAQNVNHNAQPPHAQQKKAPDNTMRQAPPESQPQRDASATNAAPVDLEQGFADILAKKYASRPASSVTLSHDGKPLSPDTQAEILKQMRTHTEKASGEKFTDANLAAYWDALDGHGKSEWLQRVKDSLAEQASPFSTVDENSTGSLTPEQIAKAQENLAAFTAGRTQNFSMSGAATGKLVEQTHVSVNTSPAAEKIPNETEILAELEKLAKKGQPGALTQEQSDKIVSAAAEELDEFVQGLNDIDRAQRTERLRNTLHEILRERENEKISSTVISGTAVGKLVDPMRPSFSNVAGDGSTFSIPLSEMQGTWEQATKPVPKKPVHGERSDLDQSSDLGRSMDLDRLKKHIDRDRDRLEGHRVESHRDRWNEDRNRDFGIG